MIENPITMNSSGNYYLNQKNYLLRGLAETLPDGFAMLEIGVYTGDTPKFMEEVLLRKLASYTGVDINLGNAKDMPALCKLIQMDSKEYWRNLPGDVMFNLIFIDGNHEGNFPQVDTDAAIRHLAPGGIIVVHDVCAANFDAAGTRHATKMLLDNKRFVTKLYVWDIDRWVGSAAVGIDIDRSATETLFMQKTTGK